MSEAEDLNIFEEFEGTATTNLNEGSRVVLHQWIKSRLRNVKKFQKKYATFDLMKTWGAVKLSQHAHALPMRTGKVLAKPKNDAVPPEWVDFIRESFLETIYPRLIKNISLWSPYYGVSEFERVWQFVDGKQFGLSGSVATYRKLRYLQAQDVGIKEDDFGDFDGLVLFPETKWAVELEKINSYIYTWNEEGSSNNLYGTSMNDELIPWFSGYFDIVDQYKKYLSKSTGAAPIITYPEGQSNDASGALINNFDIAMMLADQIDRNEPTVIPSNMSEIMTGVLQSNQAFNPSMIKDLQKWQIEWEENSGSASSAFLDGLRYFDHQAFHQWLILPRAVEEGKFGTKAESGEHKELMMQLALVELQEILQQLTETLVADQLEINFGVEARGAVFLQAESIDPRVIDLASDLIKLVYGNVNNLGEFNDIVKEGELLDIAGVPRSSDEEIEEAREERPDVVNPITVPIPPVIPVEVEQEE